VQHGLAVTLTDMGELEEASKLSQGANKSYQKIFGPDHPHNMNIVTNLASVFSLEGDYAEAEGYYRRYLKYLVYHPGQADRRTIRCLRGLAECLEKQNPYEEAAKYYHKAY